MAQNIIEELQSTATELLALVGSFTQEQINVIPFEGSWTAAQVAQHLLQSYSAVDVLSGAVQATERPPDYYCEQLKSSFLNFDKKMTSPDFVRPAALEYDKDTLLRLLSAKLDSIHDAVKTLDLSQTCLDFVLPGADTFTRLEWTCFMLYHTQRHIHQLHHIYRTVADSRNEVKISS